MNVLIAPDKFRGSLDADEVCDAIARGVLMASPSAQITKTPLADGGEGTSQILTKNTKGTFRSALVQDPLGRKIAAQYGVSADGKTAYIELSAASGLHLLKKEEQNPLATSTYGTGELIVDALDSGVETIILGIGGSATNDAGAGIAAALGYRFFDANGCELSPTGATLSKICSIDKQKVHPLVQNCTFRVACDVTNPLYGQTGAAHIYAPQKGADHETVNQLDDGLRAFAHVATSFFQKDVSDCPGAGAAGGVGAGAMWFMNAHLQEGIHLVMEHLLLAEKIRQADLVITGEGKADEQTLSGKVVSGLATLCRESGTPLALLCGTLAISPQQAKELGITYATSVLNRPVELLTAQKEAAERVVESAYYLTNLLISASNKSSSNLGEIQE